MARGRSLWLRAVPRHSMHSQGAHHCLPDIPPQANQRAQSRESPERCSESNEREPQKRKRPVGLDFRPAVELGERVRTPKRLSVLGIAHNEVSRQAPPACGTLMENEMPTTHRWTRPTTITTNIPGGYVLLRSHALLALWQQYRAGHLSLLDLRVDLAAAISTRFGPARVARRDRPRKTYATPSLEVELSRARRLQAMTAAGDVRRVRASLRRLAAAGVPSALLLSRATDPMPITLVIAHGIADRPVPVPRRWLGFLARHGTAATIAAGLAMLLRGAFFKAGAVHLGGTCSATWVTKTFGLDERTAKSGRARLVQVGLVRLEASPHWHRQRYGMTFIPLCPPTAGARSSPPRTASDAPTSPPPRKNENDSLREQRNQNGKPSRHDRPTLMPSPVTRKPLALSDDGPPTLANVRHDDLIDPERRAALYHDVLARGLIDRSESASLRFQTTVRHCLRVGKNPPALFASLARSKCWHFGSQGDEEAARHPVRKRQSDPPIPLAQQRPRPPGRPFQIPPDRVAPEVARDILRGLLASLEARRTAAIAAG